MNPDMLIENARLRTALAQTEAEIASLRDDARNVWAALDAGGVPERGARNGIRVELLVREREQWRGVAEDAARERELTALERDAWKHIGAQSASALARVQMASDRSANYYELGNRIEDILGELPPAPAALLDLVSAAVDVNDAWQTGAGIDAAVAALMAAVAAAWQAELTKH